MTSLVNGLMMNRTPEFKNQFQKWFYSLVAYGRLKNMYTSSKGGVVNFNIYIYLKLFFDKLTTDQKKISKSLNFDGKGAGGSRPIWEPFP